MEHWLDKCNDYALDVNEHDRDSKTPYKYDLSSGMIYDNDGAHTLENGQSCGGECTRCGTRQCLSHAHGACPDVGEYHNSRCLSNHTAEGIVNEYNPDIIESVKQSIKIDHDHLISHIANQLYKVNNSFYHRMRSENPYGTSNDIYQQDDPDVVRAFKKKNDFVTKIIPDAIEVSIKNALYCNNPYNRIDWDSL